MALFVPALGALLAALSYANALGWRSMPVLGAFVVTVVLGSAFLLRERRAVSSMINLRLFRRAAFSAGVSSGLLSYLVLFGSLFVTPFFLENGRGLSAAAAGACLTALSVATALVSPLAGRLADAVSARLLTVAGMLVSAVALALLAAQHGATVRVVVGLALLGLGIGLFVPANNAAIMSSVPREQLGAASGMLNMARSLGTALELSLTGRVFAAVAGARARPELVSRGYTAAMLLPGGGVAGCCVARCRAARRSVASGSHAVVDPI